MPVSYRLATMAFVVVAAVVAACSSQSSTPYVPPAAASLNPVDVYDFKGTPFGAEPKGPLVAAGSMLYGTTYWGGVNDEGSIFSLDPRGNVKTIHSFGGTDGSHPIAGLTSAGPFLYGTAYWGGHRSAECLSGCGTVYRYDVAGHRLLLLHFFGGRSHAENPYAGVIDAGGTLYGTTDAIHTFGTVYELKDDGTGFSVIHEFQGNRHDDGSTPKGDLVYSDGTFLGTTQYGGSVADRGYGVIYRFRATNPNFGIIHKFLGWPSTLPRHPVGGLFKYGDTYYGTASSGGTYGCGGVYSLGPKGFAVLHEFACAPSDGNEPFSKLTAANGLLYGTTYKGGTDNIGTVFAVSTDGKIYTSYGLPNADGKRPHGAYPYAGLVLHDGTLYGTTQNGGTYDKGTIFRVAPLPGNPTPTPSASPTATPSPTPSPTPSTPPSTAPTFATVHLFTGGHGGANPVAPLTAANGNLYGTTYNGGVLDSGTFYEVGKHGFQVLYLFNPLKGVHPHSNLIVRQDRHGVSFYGTTESGGDALCHLIGCGVIFEMAVTSEHVGPYDLHHFSDGDGDRPIGDIVESGRYLYGTTFIGGASVFTNSRPLTEPPCPPECGTECPAGCGVVWSLDRTNNALNVLHAFKFNVHRALYDGAYPKAGPLLVGHYLYGTTAGGGRARNVTDHDGTIYRIDLTNNHYELLHSFNGGSGGSFPEASLVTIGGNLYGVAQSGGRGCGVRGCGVVFEIDLSGPRAVERVLYSFGGKPDGAYPLAGLVYSGGWLYGTTSVGGKNDYGTVFRISPAGLGYGIVHSFDGKDGANPMASLVVSGTTIYGTTDKGGVNDNGTVFALRF